MIHVLEVGSGFVGGFAVCFFWLGTIKADIAEVKSILIRALGK